MMLLEQRKENSKISFTKKKILVYDTSRGIASEIKKKFNYDYEIVFCIKKNDLNNVDLNSFFATIIIINDYEDLIKIDLFKRKIKNIIASSSLKENHFSLNEIPDLTTFELNTHRKNMISFIKENLIKFEAYG